MDPFSLLVVGTGSLGLGGILTATLVLLHQGRRLLPAASPAWHAFARHHDLVPDGHARLIGAWGHGPVTVEEPLAGCGPLARCTVVTLRGAPRGIALTPRAAGTRGAPTGDPGFDACARLGSDDRTLHHLDRRARAAFRAAWRLGWAEVHPDGTLRVAAEGTALDTEALEGLWEAAHALGHALHAALPAAASALDEGEPAPWRARVLEALIHDQPHTARQVGATLRGHEAPELAVAAAQAIGPDALVALCGRWPLKALPRVPTSHRTQAHALARPALRALLAGPDPDERQAAALALAEAGDRSDTARLRRAADEGRIPARAAGRAVRTLQARHPPAAGALALAQTVQSSGRIALADPEDSSP